MQSAYTAECLTKRTEQSERRVPLPPTGGGEGKVKGLFEGNFACKPLDPVVLKIYLERPAQKPDDGKLL
jgi:hypothetical protein